MVGPLNRKGTSRPRPNPGIIISPMAVNSREDDQFNPGLLDLFAACLENCMLLSKRLMPVGLSESISFSRLLTLTTVSPEAVCSIRTTCFFRGRRNTSDATLTASSMSAKTTTKETMTVRGIS